MGFRRDGKDGVDVLLSHCGVGQCGVGWRDVRWWNAGFVSVGIWDCVFTA